MLPVLKIHSSAISGAPEAPTPTPSHSADNPKSSVARTRKVSPTTKARTKTATSGMFFSYLQDLKLNGNMVVAKKPAKVKKPAKKPIKAKKVARTKKTPAKPKKG